MTAIEHVVRSVPAGRGRVELIAACRRMALEDGTTLEEMLYEVVKGIAREAAYGDVKAAELLLKWFANGGPVEPGAAPGVVINNNVGPPLPSDAAAYAAAVRSVIDGLDLKAETDRLLS